MTTPFVEYKPTLENYWRSVILFGLNVASYKFALGKALLDLSPQGNDFVTLETLAEPFSRYVCEHLRSAPKQGTFAESTFLNACKSFNDGKLSQDQLIGETVRLGFKNVIDAFHVVNRGEIGTRFFVDERKGSQKGIRLTDDIRTLREAFQFRNLPGEIEARWRLVETSWELKLPRHFIAVEYDETTERLFVDRYGYERRDVTGCRDALNGYQRGKCFYCRTDISIESGGVDVDHFFPHTLHRSGFLGNPNGVWNLVLSCVDCNRGTSGKFAWVPELRFLERLYRRGEYLIGSFHPLRETLMAQTGVTPEDRKSFLQTRWNEAVGHLIHTWHPENELESDL